jgi:hypothetical protein
MALHLIKLCVGAASIDDLRDWWDEEHGRKRLPIVHTRQTPKRAEELTEGGSLYWVIKGTVLVRQTILGVETLNAGGQSFCHIRLDRTLHLTLPQPRRAFQGWRYLEPKDAPADLSSGDGETAMPADLAVQLRELGAW